MFLSESRLARTQAVGMIPIYALEACSHSAVARAQAAVAERRLAFKEVSFGASQSEEDAPDSATAARARAGSFLRFFETRPDTRVAVVAH